MLFWGSVFTTCYSISTTTHTVALCHKNSNVKPVSNLNKQNRPTSNSMFNRFGDKASLWHVAIF